MLAGASIDAAHQVMSAIPRTQAGLGAQLIFTCEYCATCSELYLFGVAARAARLLGCTNELSPELAKLVDEWPV
jgi:hypothetical protein